MDAGVSGIFTNSLDLDVKSNRCVLNMFKINGLYIWYNFCSCVGVLKLCGS
jgi:hypothetical protein